MNLIIVQTLIQIKNASASKQNSVSVQKTSFSVILVVFLYQNCLIQGYKIEVNRIIIFLRLLLGSNSLTNNIKLVSTPSLKKYVSYENVCSIKATNLCYVFSTSKGLLNLIDCKKFKTGGTLLFIC